MNDERPPLEPIDDEELRSAAALARALEGGGADPVLSGAELETAALLRLAAGVAGLGEQRRAELKAELLAGLSSRSETRRRPVSREPARGLGQFARAWSRWFFGGRVPQPARIFFLALPLGSAALVSLFLLTRAPDLASPLAERPVNFEPVSSVESPVPAPSSPEGAALAEQAIAAPELPAEEKRGRALARGLGAAEAADTPADEEQAARDRTPQASAAVRLARRGVAEPPASRAPTSGASASRAREPGTRQALTDVGKGARAERSQAAPPEAPASREGVVASSAAAAPPGRRPASAPVPAKAAAKARASQRAGAATEGERAASGAGDDAESDASRLRQRLDRAYRASSPDCPAARKRETAVCDLASQICQRIDRDPNVAAVAEYCSEAKERCHDTKRLTQERCPR